MFTRDKQMKFKQICHDYLSNELCLNVLEFESTLQSMLGDKAQYFDSIVEFMINDESSKIMKTLEPPIQDEEFYKFHSRCIDHLKSKTELNEDFSEYANELICYFDRLYCGGLKELFKFRQAENRGPRIYLNKRIVPDNQINDNLPENITAYRGMSIEEFKSGSFGMSWSLDKTIACRFARNIYYDQKKGVIAKAIIARDLVLYFDPDDNEKEIVVEDRKSVV